MRAADGGDAPKKNSIIEDKTPWPLLMVGDPPVYLLAPTDRVLGELIKAVRAARSPDGISEIDMLKMLLTTAEIGAAAQEAVALARRQGRVEGAAAEREASRSKALQALQEANKLNALLVAEVGRLKGELGAAVEAERVAWRLAVVDVFGVEGVLRVQEARLRRALRGG